MARTEFAGRVADVEHRVDAIEQRFDRLDGQISQFREEMQMATAATNSRVDAVQAEIVGVKVELRRSVEDLRGEMHVLHEESMAAIVATGAALEKRVGQGNEESRRFMRVLHEEVIERLERIQKG